jgi:hypothetical protein
MSSMSSMMSTMRRTSPSTDITRSSSSSSTRSFSSSTMTPNTSLIVNPRFAQNTNASPFQRQFIVPFATPQTSFGLGVSPNAALANRTIFLNQAITGGGYLRSVEQTQAERNFLVSGTLAPLTGISPLFSGMPLVLPSGFATTFGLGLPFGGAAGGVPILTAGTTGQIFPTLAGGFGSYLMPW